MRARSDIRAVLVPEPKEKQHVGTIKKKRRAKMSKHKHRKRLKANRHKNK
jgi:hypothetical protein